MAGSGKDPAIPSHRMATETLTPTHQRPSAFRRASTALNPHPTLRLLLLLALPLVWMVLIYLGSLAVLFANAFWRVDVFTAQVVHDWGLQNFETLLTEPVYRTITLRTTGIAAAVAVTDVVIGFPLAYYAARLAGRRARGALLVAVVVPLWSSYLVKAFAWQTITAPNGVLEAMLAIVGIQAPDIGKSQWAIWLTFSYLWLPFVVLPIFAALERVPSSFLEASSDLGAREWTTFRRVTWPLAIPGIVAGSIFAFSLTLGDYIAPGLVGNTKFIGNVIYENVGVANNLPFAAAYALVPVAIMAVYLFIAKKLGAFEAL